MQNDHCNPVSHVMTLKNHIFTLVPSGLVEVDWRLPVFPCGRSLIAFDGAALLVHELYLRNLRNKKKNYSFNIAIVKGEFFKTLIVGALLFFVMSRAFTGLYSGYFSF